MMLRFATSMQIQLIPVNLGWCHSREASSWLRFMVYIEEEKNVRPEHFALAGQSRSKRLNPGVLLTSEGKLFCTLCNTVVEQKRKSSRQTICTANAVMIIDIHVLN